MFVSAAVLVLWKGSTESESPWRGDMVITSLPRRDSEPFWVDEHRVRVAGAGFPQPTLTTPGCPELRTI